MIATRRKIYTDKLLGNLLDAQKNMASAEKVDAKGLVYLSRFILRLLKQLDDEVIALCAETEEISGDAKEIAALVLAVQERQSDPVSEIDKQLGSKVSRQNEATQIP